MRKIPFSPFAVDVIPSLIDSRVLTYLPFIASHSKSKGKLYHGAFALSLRNNGLVRCVREIIYSFACDNVSWYHAIIICEINRHLSADLIDPSKYPGSWCSPLPKKKQIPTQLGCECSVKWPMQITTCT